MIINENIADLVILGILGISTIIGLVRGFVKESISLGTWLFAMWIGFHYWEEISKYFIEIDSPIIQIGLVVVVIAAATFFLSNILKFIFGSIVKLIGLGFIDKLIGALFGLTKAAIIVAFVILLASPTNLKDSDWWKESLLIPRFEIIVDFLNKNIPKSVVDNLKLD